MEKGLNCREHWGKARDIETEGTLKEKNAEKKEVRRKFRVNGGYLKIRTF